MSIYCCSNKPVLHPPVEPGQVRSSKLVHQLNRHQMVGSMGRVRGRRQRRD
jgi:hypothetical protein